MTIQEWCIANPERQKASVRRWHKANPEKVKANLKRWYQRNRKLHGQRVASWRSRNADRHKAYQAKWRSENRDKRCEYEARRRTKKRGSTSRETVAIMRIYQRCKELRKWFDVCVDHIVPLAKDGKHEAENLQIIYQFENFRKNASLNYKAKVVFL